MDFKEFGLTEESSACEICCKLGYPAKEKKWNERNVYVYDSNINAIGGYNETWFSKHCCLGKSDCLQKDRAMIKIAFLNYLLFSKNIKKR